MSVTRTQLFEIMPTAAGRLDAWLDPINSAMEAYGITTLMRAAMFLASVAEESQELSRLTENLNYSSGMRIKYMFPTHFADEAEANAFAHNPEKLANRVYGGRMGNGPEASGDGWKYRGRGLIQLTGREEYAAYGTYTQSAAVMHPELLELPQHAANSAAWFIAEYKGANGTADLGDFGMYTRKVNGGMEGWVQRKKYFDAAKAALS